MLNEVPESAGPLARDSSRGDASNAPAGTRVVLHFSFESLVDRHLLSVANGTLATLPNTKYHCSTLSLVSGVEDYNNGRSLPIRLGFTYLYASEVVGCGEGTEKYAGVSTANSIQYTLDYDGDNGCTIRVSNSWDALNGEYFPLRR